MLSPYRDLDPIKQSTHALIHMDLDYLNDSV